MRGTAFGQVKDQERKRLYPRCADILNQLNVQGARLVWCKYEARYRVNGEAGRSRIVIPRTLRKLLRLKALRVGCGDHADIQISSVGSDLLRRHAKSQAKQKSKVKGRRAMSSQNLTQVNSFFRKVRVTAIVWDETNIEAMDALLSPEGYRFSWNRETKKLDLLIRRGARFEPVMPGFHIVCEDEHSPTSIDPKSFQEMYHLE